MCYYPSMTPTTNNLTVTIPVHVLYSISLLPPVLIDPSLLELELSISRSLAGFHSQSLTNNRSEPAFIHGRQRGEEEGEGKTSRGQIHFTNISFIHIHRKTFVHDYVLKIIVKLGHHYRHDPTSLCTAGYLPETRRARRRC